MKTHNDSIARTVLNWRFITALLVLATGAVALQPAVARLAAHFSKEEIAIRKPLEQFDETKLTQFRRVPLPAALEQYLSGQDVGTDEVINRMYEEKNSQLGSDSTVRDVMTLITYYSDPRDQIPHTPEVCYRQDGTIVNSITPLTIDVPGLSGGTRSIKFRLLDLEQARSHLALLYVFCCEGNYFDDREEARLAIAMPGNAYTYFAKIESIVPMTDPKDFDDAVERAKRFMLEALPILVNDHLPTDEQIRRE